MGGARPQASRRRHAVPQKRLLVGASGNTGLWALRLDDGRDIWRKPLPEGGVSGSTPYAGGLLVSTTRYGLFFLNALDGGVIDAIDTGSGFAMQPAAYGRRAFVMNNQGHLLSLHVDAPGALRLGCLFAEATAGRRRPHPRGQLGVRRRAILLAKLKKEMTDRFDIIKKAGRTSIDPELDKKDIIVIAVDEASVLYGKTKVSKIKAQNATHARELTDDLAKLGRAAKMNLIIATQKVTTETIDTKIQENMGGRICFKANTLQGSMTVLGNKMAYDLPDIKGRAIWNNGTTFVEIQTPFISDNVIASEIKNITEEFKNGTKKLYSQPFTAQAEVEQDRKENQKEK